MVIQITDESFMMIFLLEACNLDCPHCIREEEPMESGYRLSLRQLRSCLADCRAVGSIRRVHFSGGEPTLWREGRLGLVDLLVEIAESGFTPGFVSNGRFFDRYKRCYDFFRRYADGASVPLRFYLSVDTFHENFDPESGRAPCLDNILRCKRELPAAAGRLLGEPEVLVAVSRDPASLLPEEMITYYRAQGIRFGFVPLQYMGKARSLRELCPKLDSDDPEDLGAFGRYAESWKPAPPDQEPHELRADYPILIGGDYWVHNMIAGEPPENVWRKIGKLGQLSRAFVYGPGDASVNRPDTDR